MTNYSSPSAAHTPSHGGYPAPHDTCNFTTAEPTMAECAARLGFETVAEMTDWLMAGAQSESGAW